MYREEFEKNRDKSEIIVSAVDFMKKVNAYADSVGRFSWLDNPSCAFLGIYDMEDKKVYYCFIEDLKEEELMAIDSLKQAFIMNTQNK